MIGQTRYERSATHHTWSLAVEEQFYLLWPLLMAKLPRIHLRTFLVLIIVAAPFIRVMFALVAPGHKLNEPYYFHTRYDFLAVGCLLAAEYHRGAKWIDTATKIPLTGLMAAAILLEAASIQSFWFRLSVGYTAQALLFGILVIAAVKTKESSFQSRVLNSPLFVHIGLISYSLYLWQQIFTTTAAFRPFTEPVLGVVATFVCAELSFRLIEHPFARVRARLRTNTS